MYYVQISKFSGGFRLPTESVVAALKFTKPELWERAVSDLREEDPVVENWHNSEKFKFLPMKSERVVLAVKTLSFRDSGSTYFNVSCRKGSVQMKLSQKTIGLHFFPNIVWLPLQNMPKQKTSTKDERSSTGDGSAGKGEADDGPTERGGD